MASSPLWFLRRMWMSAAMPVPEPDPLDSILDPSEQQAIVEAAFVEHATGNVTRADHWRREAGYGRYADNEEDPCD